MENEILEITEKELKDILLKITLDKAEEYSLQGYPGDATELLLLLIGRHPKHKKTRLLSINYFSEFLIHNITKIDSDMVKKFTSIVSKALGIKLNDIADQIKSMFGVNLLKLINKSHDYSRDKVLVSVFPEIKGQKIIAVGSGKVTENDKKVSSLKNLLSFKDPNNIRDPDVIDIFKRIKTFGILEEYNLAVFKNIELIKLKRKIIKSLWIKSRSPNIKDDWPQSSNLAKTNAKTISKPTHERKNKKKA